MSTEPTASVQPPVPTSASVPAEVPARHELQFVLPEQPTNLKTMFGGATVIYIAAAIIFAFVLWLRPPVPYLTALVPPEQVDITDIIFQNVVGPTGGGGGGGHPAPKSEPIKVEPKPAIKPPAPPPTPVPIEQPPPPPDITPPAAAVPAVATDNQLALLNPNGPPSPGTNVGKGGDGAGGGQGPGQGPGNGAGLGPGSGTGVGDGPGGGGGVDVQVVALYTPKPAYTSQAMLRRVQGEVALSCIVLATGKVSDCRITKSLDSNNFGLDDEALKAASKFLFKPAMRQGKPVPVRVNIVLDFNLR